MKNTLTVYTSVPILPSPGGFGRWERGELDVSPETSWAFRSDLESEMENNSDAFLPIGEAIRADEFRNLGVVDIRGLIENEPARIYARIADGRLSYLGVESTEVPTGFFA